MANETEHMLQTWKRSQSYRQFNTLRETQPKENVEPASTHTSTIADIFVESIWNKHLKKMQNTKVFSSLTYFKQHVEKTELQARELVQIEVPVPSLFVSITITIYMSTKFKQKFEEEHLTTSLLPSSTALFLSGTKRRRATLPHYWLRLPQVPARQGCWLR